MSGGRATRVLRRVGWVVLALLCIYLVARAVVEIGMVVVGDGLDESDWGGPSTAGILAVHCLPGLVGAVVLWWLLRRRATVFTGGRDTTQRRSAAS